MFPSRKIMKIIQCLVIRQASEVVFDGFNRQVVLKAGLVFSWASILTMRVTCQETDVSSFPFDDQFCTIDIAPFILSNTNYRLGNLKKSSQNFSGSS